MHLTSCATLDAGGFHFFGLLALKKRGSLSTNEAPEDTPRP